MKKVILNIILLMSVFTKSGNAQNIWEPTNGPNGLSLSFFIITSDNTLVVSANNSGIYFSKDQGVTWLKKSNGLNHTNSFATSLAAGPNGLVYAMIDQELYKLESNSDDWIKTNQVFINSIIFTNTDGWIFIVSRTNTMSVFLSKDNGNTYKNIFEKKPFKNFEAFTFNGHGNNYFIVEENGSYNVYRVEDDGSNIVKVHSVISPYSRLYWSPAGSLFIIDPPTNSFPTDGLFKIDGNDNKVTKINSLPVKINLISIKQDGSLIAFSRDGDYESINSGLSWTKKATELYKLIDPDYRIFFNNLDTYAWNFSCVGTKLSKTSDGGKNWTSLDDYYLNPYVTDIYFDKSGNLFSKNCDNYKYAYSRDKGQHWQLLNLPVNYFYATDLVSTLNGDLIIKTYPEVYKSHDFGKTWDEYKIEGDSIYNRIIGDLGNILFAFGDRGNYISNDGGNKWKPIAKPPVSVRYLKFHPDGSIFLIGYSQSEIFISSNSGLSWQKCKSQFQSIWAFHINLNGDIYISGTEQSFNSGLFISRNKLETIEKLNDIVYNSLTSDKNDNLYSLPIGGLCYKSIDKGKTWYEYSSGLPLGPYTRVLSIDENQNLFLGFNNDVVYKTLSPVTNSVKTSDEKSPSQIIIIPNPVESKMIFTISDKNISSGHYRIVDLSGTEKLNGEFDSNRFTIDCSTLPNGIAFIQIIGENKLYATEKIIIQH
jgi:photosystem II stability/assembly factor-like uncharacterized protein